MRLFAVVAYLGLLVAVAWGWVLNAIAIAHSDFSRITGLLVLRVVGIFLAPLGGVLGLFVP